MKTFGIVLIPQELEVEAVVSVCLICSHGYAR